MKTSPRGIDLLGDALPRVLRSLSLDEPADRDAGVVAAQARAALAADAAIIVVPCTDSAGWRVAAAAGLPPEHVPALLDTSLVLTVLEVGSRFHIDGRLPNPDAERLGRCGLASALLVPLAVEKRVTGVLCVARRRGRPPFDEAELDRAAMFGQRVAVALHCANRWREQSAMAVVADRERIARDLHDGVIQSLIAVAMRLSTLAESSEARGLVGEIKALIESLKKVNVELRSYVLMLRSPGLDASLGESLQALIGDYESRTGVQVSVEVDEELSCSPVTEVKDLLHVVREALSNVARHADATACRVNLARCGDLVILSVEDDGQGFDISKSGIKGEGLRNLEARAAALNGRLEVETIRGRGTTVRVLCPPWVTEGAG